MFTTSFITSMGKKRRKNTLLTTSIDVNNVGQLDAEIQGFLGFFSPFFFSNKNLPRIIAYHCFWSNYSTIQDMVVAFIWIVWPNFEGKNPYFIGDLSIGYSFDLSSSSVAFFFLKIIQADLLKFNYRLPSSHYPISFRIEHPVRVLMRAYSHSYCSIIIQYTQVRFVGFRLFLFLHSPW